MAKQSPEDRLQRKLAKAQLNLGRAQEKRSAARARGEADIRQARLKAERRLVKTTTRVERWATTVSKLEQKLLARERQQPQQLDTSRSAPRIETAQPAELTGDALEAMGSHLGQPLPMDEGHNGPAGRPQAVAGGPDASNTGGSDAGNAGGPAAVKQEAEESSEAAGDGGGPDASAAPEPEA